MHYIQQKLDGFLNNITMYKLVIYSLLAIIATAFLLSLIGILSYSLLSLTLSLLLAVGTSLMVNEIASRLWNAPSNIESSFVTGLILFLILAPVLSVEDGMFIIATSAAAILSKYVIARNKKHLFNPVAFGLVFMGLLGSGAAFWWVGSIYLFPVVLIAGLLVTRKIRREALVFTALGVGLIVTAGVALMYGENIAASILQLVLSGPLIFLATFMLTEPSTTPPRHSQQIAYGAMVGVLATVPFHIGFISSTPEFALILGNIYSYIVGMKERLILVFKEKREIARDTYEFIFSVGHRVPFLAGQYLEWTVPHAHPDLRGIRRYFTIASAPEEDTIRLGIKIPKEKASTFKTTLAALTPGYVITAGALSGDFVLPKDPAQKLVFIAGGIGMTPFRSMIEHLVQTRDKRDVHLFYANRSHADIAYLDLLSRAEQEIGLRVTHVIAEAASVPNGFPAETGFIDGPMLNRLVTNIPAHHYYISGPTPMVHAYKKLLADNGVPASHIVTDYFPGFA